MPSPFWSCLCFDFGSPNFQMILGATPNIFQINCFTVLVNQSLFLFITHKITDSQIYNMKKCVLKSLDFIQFVKIKFGKIIRTFEEHLELYNTFWPYPIEEYRFGEAMREVSQPSQKQPPAALLLPFL